LQRRFLFRVVALLLLLIAGSAVYACDVSDSCVIGASGQGCDDPGGDACICCCHHIVPTMVFALERGEPVCAERPPAPVLQVLSATFPIDHPPQL
jgi:hypothetical protein